MFKVFKILGILLGCTIIYFSFNDIKITKEDLFIQNKINEKIPVKISKHNINIYFNKINLSMENNLFKSEVLIDINTKILNLNNKEANLFLKPIYENGSLFFQIIDINFKDLTFKDIKEKLVEENNEKLKNVKNKVSNFLQNKLNFSEEESNNLLKKGEKSFKKVEEKLFSQDDIRLQLLSILKNEKIKIYDLSYKSTFIKDIKFIEKENNKFVIEILINLGLLGYLIGGLIIFLSLSRELGIILINFYQKRISKHKGFSCARNKLEEGGSCSHRTKKVFEEKGFFEGMKEYFDTTNKCKEIFKDYKNNPSKYDSNNERIKNTSKNGTIFEVVENGTEISVNSCESIGSCGETSSCETSSCDSCSCDIGSC